MTVVNSRVFKENPIHYLNLAEKEEVAIKRGKKVYILLPREPEYTNKKLKGEKYLESFYQKDISEIWNDLENGKIKLTNNEVDWGKPMGNEVW